MATQTLVSFKLFEKHCNLFSLVIVIRQGNNHTGEYLIRPGVKVRLVCSSLDNACTVPINTSHRSTYAFYVVFVHLLILSHLSLECVHINLFRHWWAHTQLHSAEITNLVVLKVAKWPSATQFFITKQPLLSTTNECLSWYRPHILQDRKLDAMGYATS